MHTYVYEGPFIFYAQCLYVHVHVYVCLCVQVHTYMYVRVCSVLPMCLSVCVSMYATLKGSRDS